MCDQGCCVISLLSCSKSASKLRHSTITACFVTCWRGNLPRQISPGAQSATHSSRQHRGLFPFHKMRHEQKFMAVMKVCSSLAGGSPPVTHSHRLHQAGHPPAPIRSAARCGNVFASPRSAAGDRHARRLPFLHVRPLHLLVMYITVPLTVFVSYAAVQRGKAWPLGWANAVYAAEECTAVGMEVC